MIRTPAFAEEIRRHTSAVLVSRADYYRHPNTSCHRCGQLVATPPRCRKCAAIVQAQRDARAEAKEHRP